MKLKKWLETYLLIRLQRMCHGLEMSGESGSIECCPVMKGKKCKRKRIHGTAIYQPECEAEMAVDGHTSKPNRWMSESRLNHRATFGSTFVHASVLMTSSVIYRAVRRRQRIQSTNESIYFYIRVIVRLFDRVLFPCPWQLSSETNTSTPIIIFHSIENITPDSF